ARQLCTEYVVPAISVWGECGRHKGIAKLADGDANRIDASATLRVPARQDEHKVLAWQAGKNRQIGFAGYIGYRGGRRNIGPVIRYAAAAFQHQRFTDNDSRVAASADSACIDGKGPRGRSDAAVRSH